MTAYPFSDGVFEQGKDVVDLTMRVIRHQSVCDMQGQISWVGDNQLIVDKAKWKILQADGLLWSMAARSSMLCYLVT